MTRYLSFLLALALVACFSMVSASAQAQERHYIANDDHTDYFWSGTAEDYRAAFLSMLDYYMQLAEDTSDLPSDHQSRFNCDGSLWIYEFLTNRPQAQVDRLMDHIRAGHISFPMQSLVLLSGAMPTEAVLRDMYFAGRLERRYELDLELVVAMENQALPAGVASLWAGAGARYAWKGVCGCVSRVEQRQRPREIYHFAGPDGRSVVMKWNSLFGNNESLGGYAEARDPAASVTFMSTNQTYRAAWPWSVKGAFGYGWDDLASTTNVFVQTAQNMSTPDRRVIVSNEVDFFEDFVATHGDEIPTFSGSFGNEWDLLTASLAEVTAGMRRSVERLRSAEAMASLAALHDPTLLDGRDAARERAFLYMGLFYDHDWTANSGIGQQFREGFQRDALSTVESYVDPLYNDARDRLAGLISNPEPARGLPFMVFNPLSWNRTDVARIPLSQMGPVHVIDQHTDAEVPSQIIEVDGQRVLHVLADGVPSLGYRTYRILEGAGQAFPESASVNGARADNGLMEIELGPRGAITSLVDHCHEGRQLVPQGGALGQLNVEGTGQVEVEAQGPVLTTLSVEVAGSPAHRTRVTLYKDINRVDIEHLITENFGGNLGIDFDFGMSGFTTRHEEVGMIATVERVANGGTYADTMARTDYLTLGHFVNLSEASYGATLSSWDSSFMKVGASTIDTLDTTTPSLTAVVGMQVDGPDLGFRNQGGDTRFLNRYALRTHGEYDQAASMRFALAHQNPLIAAPLTGGAQGDLPAGQYSLMRIDDPNVVAFAVKPAEEGIEQGIIARLWNLDESPRTFELSAEAELEDATHTTHIETDIAEAQIVAGALTDTLGRQQLKTYRLALNPEMDLPDPPDDPPGDVGSMDAGPMPEDVDPVPEDVDPRPEDVALMDADPADAPVDEDPMDDLCADLPDVNDPDDDPDGPMEPDAAPEPPSGDTLDDEGGCCAAVPARPTPLWPAWLVAVALLVRRYGALRRHSV